MVNTRSKLVLKKKSLSKIIAEQSSTKKRVPSETTDPHRSESFRTFSQTMPFSGANKIIQSLGFVDSFSKRQSPHFVSSNENIEPLQKAENDYWNSGKLEIPVFSAPGSEDSVDRTIAYQPTTQSKSQKIQDGEDNFTIRTLFDKDCDFCAAGILEIPSFCAKSLQSNDDTYFVFYVIQGTLEVYINNISFSVSPGCSFEVPMGNFYSIENRCAVLAKLFFTQARYVVIDVGITGEDDNGDDLSSNE